LSVHEVRTSKSLDLFVLESAIFIVEAFRTGTCRCGEVTEWLVFPVGPANEVLITSISDLGDLSSTRFAIKTSTEFTDEKRNSKSLCISNSGCKSLLMPGEATISPLWSRLTGSASLRVHLTAIGMIVENKLV